MYIVYAQLPDDPETYQTLYENNDLNKTKQFIKFWKMFRPYIKIQVWYGSTHKYTGFAKDWSE